MAHDWGGPIGLGAMLERRDRLRAALLINTWAWELPSFVLPPFFREFRTDGLGEILALAGNLFVESIPGGMADRQTDRVMMDAYRAPFPDYWSRVGALAFQRDIPLTERDQRARSWADPRAARRLDVPVTLLWGMRDPGLPAGLHRHLAGGVPQAQVLALADAAHFVPEDRPDALSRFSSGGGTGGAGAHRRSSGRCGAARRRLDDSTLRGRTSTRRRLPNTTWRITPPKRSEIIRAS